MFVAWALLSGLGGKIHVEESPDDIGGLQKRLQTPGEFLYESCDGKFTDEDLNDEGNAFARDYFDLDRGHYLKDYTKILGGKLESLYYVQDTWANYDILRPVLDQRFREWRAKRI